MSGLIFKFFGFAIVLLIVLYSAASSFRKARKLDARILDYKREQEARKQRGVVVDPYAELAEVYSESKRKK